MCHFLEAKAHYNQTLPGFQKGHSTTALFLKLKDDIKLAMNTTEVTFGILIDYSIAFDTINHLTLLEKLHKFNFSVQALKLIYSYLSEQKQFHQVDEKSSSVRLNNFGVPQSSILGPALFNIDVINLVENFFCDALQYADDSTLYKCSNPKNLKRSTKKLESNLEAVSLWSSNNSLVFNNDKTKLMLFSTTQPSQRHNLINNEFLK